MRSCGCDEVSFFFGLDGLMREDGGVLGVILRVKNSSIASLHNATNVDMMSYATTKAATDHLVALLAAKFARWYVRVVGINPGCESSFPLAFHFLSKSALQFESVEIRVAVMICDGRRTDEV